MMNIEEQSRLSFYRQLENIGEKENIKLVRHTETGQLYVLKILDVYDKGIYDMLMSSPHPYVPQVYECIEDDGRLYVVEEYIHGITLEVYMAQNGTLDETEACRITEALCAVLSHFHSMTPQVIHRDIKPSNVMLQGDFNKNNCEYSVFLIDFNTARRYDTLASRDTQAIGTRGFAAPEQYGFSQSDARTDIYALGALLNYMLTGSLASDVRYSGNRRLEKAISTAMSIDPADRFQSASELAAALCGGKNIAGEGRCDVPGVGYLVRDSKHDMFGDGRFLPPGFRSGKPSHIIGAIAYYLLVGYMCLTMQFEDPATHQPLTPALQVVNRICILLAFLGIPFICCNYLGVWDRLPLLKIRRLPVRILGVMLYCAAWVIFMVIMCVVIELIIK